MICITMTTVITDDLKVWGSRVSRTSTSFEQRLTTLPLGVESKNDMGAWSTRLTMTECSMFAADRVPIDIITVPRYTERAAHKNNQHKHNMKNKPGITVASHKNTTHTLTNIPF